MKIYVGNLDYKVDEDDLKDIFDEYSSVSDLVIITDKYSNRSKGFGFVTMDNSDEGNRAISELNGTILKSRELVVNEAHEKSESNNRRIY